MIAFLATYAAKLVGARFAKAFVWGALILLAVLAILAAKSCYDSSVIDAHEAERVKASLEAQQKADEDEATRRAAADNRADAIEGAIRNAVEQDPEGARKDAGPASSAVLNELRHRRRP